MPGAVPADSGKFVFSLPEVPYGFINKTRTFWGAQAWGAQGSASVTVKLDDHANVLFGSVLVVGEVAAKNIANKSLLIQGDVVDLIVPNSTGPRAFSVLFRLTYSHPNLTYVSPLGVWNAYIPQSTVTLPNLFKTDWGPASTTLNSYIGQVKDMF